MAAVDFAFELVATDAPVRQATSFRIPEDDWGVLREFHEEVERLRSTRFVQNQRGGQISISWKEGEPLKSTSSGVDTDEAWALLLRLRPFVLHKEPYHFHRMKRLLADRIDNKAIRTHLNQISDAFTLRTMERKVLLRGPGRPPLSYQVVMDWLNAFEYHRYPTKRANVEKDLGVFGEDQNGLPIILFALVDMVQAILGLGDFVETLVQIQEGRRAELRCPAKYIS